MKFRSRKNEIKAALGRNRQRGLEAAALTIAGAAKEKTPVDSGRLRASIAWAADGQIRQHNEEYEHGSVAYAVGAPEGTALIGSNVEYAADVHEDPQGKVPREGGVGQSKFLEQAGRENATLARTLIARALRGEL